MQVGREDDACREDALLILAFAFAEKLFKPLVHHGKGRIVAYKQFNRFAFAVQRVAISDVFVAVVFVNIRLGIVCTRCCCALHQSGNISACNGNRQQTDGGQNGEPPANVVGNDKRFITFCIGQFLKRAARFVGSGIYTMFGLVCAVFFNQKLAEYAESERRFRRGAGF